MHHYQQFCRGMTAWNLFRSRGFEEFNKEGLPPFRIQRCHVTSNRRIRCRSRTIARTDCRNLRTRIVATFQPAVEITNELKARNNVVTGVITVRTGRSGFMTIANWSRTAP
ncbi:unnamed protein product [Cuscuta epithymum]|uniref:Uncharacterized protein n=1 Tax=Cuscuta epithymum TaxID=186058 RepID=A0AAV0FVG6_9ASTE|nr:unnamed protein product [Cuscuta epithymum]